MDLGFKNAGFDIMWANDFDPDSVKTYRRNFGDHIVLGDIEKIRTNLSVKGYGRGGCGKNIFCFALLDWETSHLQQRGMWTKEENQSLPYSAQWYLNEGMHDQRFTRNVRLIFFSNQTHN